MVNHIHNQVKKEKHHAEDQRDAGDNERIPVEDGAHEKGAHAGKIEDLLHHNRAGQNLRRHRAHEGNHREKGQLERMVDHRAAAADALGQRSPDKVVLENLDEAVAHQPRNIGRVGKRKQNCGQNDVPPAPGRR